MDINLIKRIEKRNHNVYNKLISIEKPITSTFSNITGLIIRDVKIDEYLGIGTDRRCIYRCHCTKCNQELILTTHMLTDMRHNLCYCDKEQYKDWRNHSSNLGKYAQKKYDFDIRDPAIEPLFDTWVSMRQRCNNPNNKAYYHYGGRGIKVCPEWDNKEDGFLNFYHWAIDETEWKVNSGLSIDRIDVDKGYSPENCRWADTELQNSNQTSNRYIQYNCWIFPINIWAKIAEVEYHRFYNRLRNGWDFEKVMFIDSKFSKDKMIRVSSEYNIYNKYQEWVDNGKITEVRLPLSTAFPVIAYYNTDKKGANSHPSFLFIEVSF